MSKMVLRKILKKVQALQAASLGKRNMVVAAYVGSIQVTVFERDYDDKEDGDVSTFFFFDWQDNKTLMAEWDRLNDYYNG